MQPSLFTAPIALGVGVSNGQALGHIANGEARDKLRARVKAGEMVGVNGDIVSTNLAF